MCVCFKLKYGWNRTLQKICYFFNQLATSGPGPVEKSFYSMQSISWAYYSKSKCLLSGSCVRDNVSSALLTDCRCCGLTMASMLTVSEGREPGRQTKSWTRWSSGTLKRISTPKDQRTCLAFFITWSHSISTKCHLWTREEPPPESTSALILGILSTSVPTSGTVRNMLLFIDYPSCGVLLEKPQWWKTHHRSIVGTAVSLPSEQTGTERHLEASGLH